MTISIPLGRNISLQAKTGGGFKSVGLAAVPVSGGSAPSVAGTIADGQSITISALSGESFGANGPVIDHYHDGRNGTLDAPIQATDAAVGQWDSANSNTIYKQGGKIRPLATQLTSPDNLDGKSRVIFTPSTEVFVSFWMHFDTDPTTFAASFKTAWLLDGATNDNAKYDCVLMSKNNYGTAWLIGGNTGGNVDYSPNGFLSANEWTRCTFWLKDNGASEMGYNGQFLNATKGQDLDVTPESGITMLDRASNSTSVDRINIMGDLNNNNNGRAVTLKMDGFYVAVGATSRARVEIADAENYSSPAMTEAYLCTPTSWSDTQITAVIRSPDNLTGKYIHIHDANGNHTNGGIGREIG